MVAANARLGRRRVPQANLVQLVLWHAARGDHPTADQSKVGACAQRSNSEPLPATKLPGPAPTYSVSNHSVASRRRTTLPSLLLPLQRRRECSPRCIRMPQSARRTLRLRWLPGNFCCSTQATSSERESLLEVRRTQSPPLPYLTPRALHPHPATLIISTPQRALTLLTLALTLLTLSLSIFCRLR